MKRVLLACAVLATAAHFGGSIAVRVARTFGTDSMTLDVLPDRIPDLHSVRRAFRAPCFGLCPDLGSAE
jgi:hypothetical protein